jgi:hypothetical protein
VFLLQALPLLLLPLVLLLLLLGLFPFIDSVQQYESNRLAGESSRTAATFSFFFV